MSDGDPAGLDPMARADVREFVAALRREAGVPGKPPDDFFGAADFAFLARAPGRLDVMGGIADYSGALVLEMPIAPAVHAAAAPRRDRRVRVASVDPSGARAPLLFETDIGGRGAPLVEGVAAARRFFAATREDSWAGYALGILAVWVENRGLSVDRGFDLFIRSAVPEGKGVSSSAALEIASAHALGALFGVEASGPMLAAECQQVENLVVGAPCGIMDQMTSECGHEGLLLELLCRPAEIRGEIPLPPTLALWGIDSGVRHAVGGGDYGSVRTAAFMGQRIVAERLGARAIVADGVLRLEGDPTGGYLAALDADRFAREFEGSLPESVSGGEFLERYGGTIDRVTAVDPRRRYRVRAAAAHPVKEQRRIERFASLLSEAEPGESAAELGRLMLESHRSYSSVGLGSEATDLLVDLVLAAGVDAGLYGAKITGGGSGGTVVVLGRADAHGAVRNVVESFAARRGHSPSVFFGSSPGAAAFGARRIRLGS